jgi:hypothetical protein
MLVLAKRIMSLSLLYTEKAIPVDMIALEF